jgi:TetR/AcrR family transcriptional regulator, transcriptional repressor of bet genes
VTRILNAEGGKMTDLGAHTEASAAKKTRTASKEVRRQQLIDATIKSIAKFGLSGTTMTTVSQFADLSRGLANFHFKTKQALFNETLGYLAQEHHQHWKTQYEKANLAPEAKLSSIVGAHFHPNICNRKKLAVWFAFFGEASARASYRKLVNDIDTERRALSLELCQQIIRRGSYKDVDAEDVIITLEGLYDGFWLNILMYPGEFTRLDAMKRIEGYLWRVFPDHFPQPSSVPAKD